MARQRRTFDEQVAELFTRDRNERTNSFSTPAMAPVGPSMIEENAVLNEHLADGAVALANLDEDLKATLGSLADNEIAIDNANKRLEEDAARIDSLFEEVALVPEQISTAQEAAIAAAAADAKAQTEAAEARAAAEALRLAEAKAAAAQAAATEAAKAYTDANAGGVSAEELDALRQDAQAKADAAKAAAIEAAALDATAKREQAEANAAADAKAKADKALADAKADATAKANAAEENAKADAILKMNSVANSKNATFYGTAVPTATNPKGTLAGDTYRRKDSKGNIIGEYEWDGANWAQRKMTSSSMTAVDVGILSAGTAVIDDAVARKFAAATASFQQADIGNLTVTGTTHLNDAVARTIAGDTATFIKLSVGNLVADTGVLSKAVIEQLYTEVVQSRLIKASQLEVGGNMNYASVAPSSDMWDSSTAGPGVSIVSYSSSTQKRALRFQGSASIASIYGKKIVVTPGDRIHVQGTFRNDGGQAAVGELTLGLQYLDANEATLAWDIYCTTSKEVLSHATRKTLTGISLVPDGAVYARPLASTRAATGTADSTKYAYLIDPVIRHQVGSVLIGQGAVTADKLEGDLVLTSRVVAGNPSGTRAEMSPEGFRVFAGVDGEPATEVVRMGVAATDDYFAVSKADGTLAATISQDGKISGSQVYANDELWYQGEQMSALIERLPRGVVAMAVRETSSPQYDSSKLSPYLHVNFPVEAGRLYRISTNPINFEGDGTALTHLMWAADIPCTVNNGGLLTRVYTSGSSMGYAWGTPAVHNRVFRCWWTGTLSILLAVRSIGSSKVRILGDGAYNLNHIIVEDIGILPQNTGESQDGSVAAPPIKRNFEKTWTANAVRNYQGSGAVYPINNGKLYQGLSPAGYGNLGSCAVFPDMTADLSGATINWIKVYLYFEHWYYNAGGTARIGLIGKSLPSTFKSGGLATSSGGWPKPGGRWVDIPSSFFNDFKTGKWGGISLNGDGGYGTYGYASGNPQIRINYTK